MIRVYKAVQLYISFKCLFEAPMNLALYKIYETFTSFKMLSVGCNYTVGQKLKENQGAIPNILILGSRHTPNNQAMVSKKQTGFIWIIYLWVKN